VATGQPLLASNRDNGITWIHNICTRTRAYKELEMEKITVTRTSGNRTREAGNSHKGNWNKMNMMLEINNEKTERKQKQRRMFIETLGRSLSVARFLALQQPRPLSWTSPALFHDRNRSSARPEMTLVRVQHPHGYSRPEFGSAGSLLAGPQPRSGRWLREEEVEKTYVVRMSPRNRVWSGAHHLGWGS